MKNIKAKPGQDPDGDYGKYLSVEMEIIEGEFERRKLFENLVLEHPNPQTVQIANQTLAAICLACGKMSIQDSTELHDIPFIGELVVEQDRRNRNVAPGQPPYPPVNRVKAYRAMNLGGEASQQQAKPASALPNGAHGIGGGVSATGGGGGTNFPQTQRGASSSGGAGLPWNKR
jgi:hypothetical protein